MGQRYWLCNCPIWVRGQIDGRGIREATGLTDWEEAVDFANAWMRLGVRPPAVDASTTTAPPMSLEEAWDEFVTRKQSAHRLREPTLYKYRHLKSEMLAFTRPRGLVLLKDCALNVLESFQSGWKQADITCLKELERLKAFFRFCHTRGWIDANPAVGLMSPKVRPKQTLPFTPAEMQRMIAATYRYRDKSKHIGQSNAKRLLALILLLRYSGLRIGGEASRCGRRKLVPAGGIEPTA